MVWQAPCDPKNLRTPTPWRIPARHPTERTLPVRHFDATSAECLVFTYKEGLLSALAHDLEIRVPGFEVDVDDATLAVRARADPPRCRWSPPSATAPTSRAR